MTFTLPSLPYDYDALESYLSHKTLEFHHDKHHTTYVATLNTLVKESEARFIYHRFKQLTSRRKQMPGTSPQQQKIFVSILAGLGASLLLVNTSGSYDAQSDCVPQVANRPIGRSPRFSSLREASPTRRFCEGKRFANANANVIPILTPIVSSDPASELADFSTTAGVATTEQQPVRLNSAQSALKEAQVAVSLSQAQLVQARINLIEFQAKHDSAKILSAQGKVSRKQADLALAAYKLAQLQHSSASIGLRDSKTQLIAAKAEVSRLGCKASAVNQM
jgi:Iron/manganese superoxide dismutases, alpha-hairpin domain